MIIDTTLDNSIKEKLLADNKVERANHTPSGKLSASMLGEPTQWQILKMISVPAKELDGYTLMKFLRGKDVEDRIVPYIKGLIARQAKAEYRDVICYTDALVDTKGWQFKVGVIPVEIKSVTNMDFKWITKRGEAKPHHRLQAAFPAIAADIDNYAIVYVASDDYRTHTFILEAKDEKKMIDTEIDEVARCLKEGILPVFEPKQDWHKNKEYNKYIDWVGLTSEQSLIKLKKEYPESYKKLTCTK